MSTETKHIYDLVGRLNYEAELHQTVTMEDRYHKELMERSAIRISSLEAQLAKANENLDFQSKIIEATDEALERNVRLEAQNKELREALQAVINDLRDRAECDSTGTLVVAIGAGIYQQAKQALSGGG
jgi:cell division protein FtsX